MKKTQFALAALALVASTAALADGVTVYGNLDAGIANQNSGAGTALRGTFAEGNWNGGSAFGLRGSEDLGGGLKAGFTLESGFKMNDGTMANGGTIPTLDGSATTTQGFFNRQANISLSGDFGTLTVGQQLNQYIAGALGTNLPNAAFGAFTVGSIINGANGGIAGGFFTPNAITYAMPTIGGLNAAIQTQLKGSGADANSMTSLSASFAVSDISVSAGYIDRSSVHQAYTIGASMPIGAVTLNLRYTTSDPTGATKSTNQIAGGVAYALSEGVTLSLQHADNSGASSAKLTNLAAHYALSKTTGVYAMYSMASNGAGMFYSGGATNTTTDTSNSGIAVGVNKSF